MTSIPEGDGGSFRAHAAEVLGSLRFGHPEPAEWRGYYQAVSEWFLAGRPGPAPSQPLDLLEPFRAAWGDPPKRPISIRVDEWLLALTREMARQLQMPYQEVIRVWMEEGMRRALDEGLRPQPHDAEPHADDGTGENHDSASLDSWENQEPVAPW